MGIGAKGWAGGSPVAAPIRHCWLRTCLNSLAEIQYETVCVNDLVHNLTNTRLGMDGPDRSFSESIC